LDFRQTDDGGFLVLTENQSVVMVPKVSGTPQNPRVTYTENFFYDDLIVYKLNDQGDLSWVKRIPKTQQSINDQGKFLSVAHAVTSDKLYLLFNDVRRNYNATGQFIDGQFPYPMQFISGNNVIAYVEMNLSDGSLIRQSRAGLTENKVTLVPKLCTFNHNAGEMIVYGQRNRRHRFGFMKMR
jgi:hypothetical protein